MVQVLDYSAGFPSVAAIQRAGYVGAVRYIGFPSRTKCTNRAEFEGFSRHGLGMALVYEDHADDWRGGHAQGVNAGRRAREHANAIGFPSGRPIYMAVDRDVVTSGEFAVMVEYLRGAATTLGGVHLTGVYGEHDVCARASGDGVASWFWQCRAWSGTPIKYFPGRHLFQRTGTVTVGGIACDINDVTAPDWGQHNAATGDDMALSAEDLKQIYDAVWFGVPGARLIENRARAAAGEPAAGEWPETLLGSIVDRTVRQQLVPLRAEVAGLTAAVAALSVDKELTRDEMAAIVRDAVQQSIQITGTVQVTPAGDPV